MPLYASAIAGVRPKSEIKWANLIFRTGFNGLSLGSLVTLGANHYWQYITGTDADTGFSVPGDLQTFFDYDTDVHMQFLPSRNTTAVDLPTYMDSVIVYGDAPGGRKGFYLDTNAYSSPYPPNTGVPPQTPLNILRYGHGGVRSLKNIDNMYLEYWIKLPANLSSQMPYPNPGNWWEIFGVKSGDWLGNSSAGDYRTTLSAFKGASGLYWHAGLDDAANNSASTITGYSQTLPGSTWTIDKYGFANTAGGSVALDTWTKVQIWLKRPIDYNDVTTGRTWMAVTPESTGSRLIVCDIQGGHQKGIGDLPWTRIFPFNVYSGGNYPLGLKFTDLSIYDGYPYHPATLLAA